MVQPQLIRMNAYLVHSRSKVLSARDSRSAGVSRGLNLQNSNIRDAIRDIYGEKSKTSTVWKEFIPNEQNRIIFTLAFTRGVARMV